MRLIFIGSTRFGLRCLEEVLHMPEIEVVGIITNQPTFSISYRPEGVRNVLYADFRPLAGRHGTPVWIMQGNMNDPGLVAQIRGWKPDFMLVVGWYHLLPRVIRDIAPAAGLHASLLPDYSGGAPLAWVIINDEKKTGITLFLLSDGVDDGPIIGQVEVPIHFEDTIATLYERVEEAGLRLLKEHLPRVARGEASYTAQDETRRRIMPQRSPGDGAIDWGWPARQIYNFIRAQTRPYPGAFTYWGKEKIIIWKAGLLGSVMEERGLPGEIVGDLSGVPGGAFAVRCGDGRVLWAQEVQLAEGAAMSGVEFLRSSKVRSGTRLGDAG
jgi:methionyl-tRNA formyltransferase